MELPFLKMHRLVLFFDSGSVVSLLLVEASLHAINQRKDFKVVGLCDTQRKKFQGGLGRSLRHAVAYGCKWVFNPEIRRSKESLVLPRFERIVGRYRVPVLQPPDGEINHPEFIKYLQKDIRPTGALCLFCRQIFKAPLLHVLEFSVNYHNALLPKYRGLAATAWSMYYGEAETGFTFHLMNERIDEGPILFSGAVPIHPHSTLRVLELEKTFQAGRQIPCVLDIMKERPSGIPQRGEASYFDRKTVQAMVVINEPSRYYAEELRKRLRCFQMLNIKIKSKWHPVTHLEEGTGSRRLSRHLDFFSADGILLRPTRFKFLPRGLYLVSQAFLKSSSE